MNKKRLYRVIGLLTALFILNSTFIEFGELNMVKLADFNTLVVGNKYELNGKHVTLEAIGSGCGRICIRWGNGKLQLVRGDVLGVLQPEHQEVMNNFSELKGLISRIGVNADCDQENDINNLFAALEKNLKQITSM